MGVGVEHRAAAAAAAAAHCRRLQRHQLELVPGPGLSQDDGSSADELERLCNTFMEPASSSLQVPAGPAPAEAVVADVRVADAGCPAAAAAASLQQLKQQLAHWQHRQQHSHHQQQLNQAAGGAAPPPLPPGLLQQQLWQIQAQGLLMQQAALAAASVPNPGPPFMAEATAAATPGWEHAVQCAAELAAAGAAPQHWAHAAAAACNPGAQQEAGGQLAGHAPEAAGGVQPLSELSLLFAQAAAASGSSPPVPITCDSPEAQLSCSASGAEDTTFSASHLAGGGSQRWFDRIDSTGRSGAAAAPPDRARQRRGRKFSDAELEVMAAQDPSRYKRIMCTRKARAVSCARCSTMLGKLAAERASLSAGASASAVLALFSGLAWPAVAANLAALPTCLQSVAAHRQRQRERMRQLRAQAQAGSEAAAGATPERLAERLQQLGEPSSTT